jgi:hypothetical protein
MCRAETAPELAGCPEAGGGARREPRRERRGLSPGTRVEESRGAGCWREDSGVVLAERRGRSATARERENGEVAAAAAMRAWWALG